MLCQHLSHSLDHVWGYAFRRPTRTWLILSCFLPVAKAFEPVVKHIFCSRLPSRTLAPTFHVSPLPFSLICSRSWCSLVAPLHCDPTSHTDYVRLSAADLPWRSRVLYATWRFSTYLWIAMCIRDHLAHVALRYRTIYRNFRHTLYMKSVVLDCTYDLDI